LNLVGLVVLNDVLNCKYFDVFEKLSLYLHDVVKYAQDHLNVAEKDGAKGLSVMRT
jgi:hypothetical protein